MWTLIQFIHRMCLDNFILFCSHCRSNHFCFVFATLHIFLSAPSSHCLIPSATSAYIMAAYKYMCDFRSIRVAMFQVARANHEK